MNLENLFANINIDTIVAVVVLAVVAYLLIKLLTKPVRFIFKLLLNALFGFVGLVLINFFGEIIGISIDINLINALVVGVFGIPGLIVLLII